MDKLRFGILIPQSGPLAQLQQRWREAEQLGFDVMFVADHSRDWRSPDNGWFDAWTLLPAMAQATSTIRVGTLVTNPLLRPPVTVAKAATTIDHLSGGRLELGIGTGIAPFDHQATGVPYWTVPERVARFREYVELVDMLVRGGDEPVTYEGHYHRVEGVTLHPRPVQRPRPPLIVGGQSAAVRKVAVQRADTWNTHGPFGSGVDEIITITSRQNRELDDWCEAAGRSPISLRRSLLLFESLVPWNSRDTFTSIVDRFTGIGISEFDVIWPEHDAQRKVFEHVATEVLPRLRN